MRRRPFGACTGALTAAFVNQAESGSFPAFLDQWLAAFGAPPREVAVTFTVALPPTTPTDDTIYIARQLAAAGAKLVLAARSADKLAALETDLRGTGADVVAVPSDITRPEPQAMVQPSVPWPAFTHSPRKRVRPM